MLTFVLLAVEKDALEYVRDRVVVLAGSALNKIHLVFGEYDLLFKVKSNRPEDVNELLREVKRIDGVQYMKTYVVAHRTKDSDVLPKERVILHH